jgi:hypothetical protein
MMSLDDVRWAAHWGPRVEAEVSRLCSAMCYEPRPGPAAPAPLFAAIAAQACAGRPGRRVARVCVGAFERASAGACGCGGESESGGRLASCGCAAAACAAAAFELIDASARAVGLIVLRKPGGPGRVDVVSDDASTLLAASCVAARALRALLRLDGDSGGGSAVLAAALRGLSVGRGGRGGGGHDRRGAGALLLPPLLGVGARAARAAAGAGSWLPRQGECSRQASEALEAAAERVGTLLGNLFLQPPKGAGQKLDQNHPEPSRRGVRTSVFSNYRV